MASARRSCRNNPDFFCYICGEYTLAMHRKGITSFVKRAYQAYFQVKLGDQDKSWAPHTVCKTCVEYLRRWTKGTKTSLKFGMPMVWRNRLTMNRIVTSAPSILLASTGRIGAASSTPTFHLPAVQLLTAKNFL